MNAHLTEAQLYNLLDAADPAAGTSDAHQHARTCTACATELASLRRSLTLFREASTHLAQHYTPTRLLERPAAARTGFFTIPRAAWGAGLVAAMALCTASVSMLHKPVVPVIPVAQQAADAQSDDALLNSIDSDLATSVPPSLQPLDVPAASENQ